MEFKDVDFFGNPEDSEEKIFKTNLEEMAKEGSLALGLEDLAVYEASFRDTPDNESDEHKRVKEKIALQIDFMNENGLADEAQAVLGSLELGSNAPESKETQDEIKQKAEDLWEAGDKVAALEAVLGRYVNASELQKNPIFQILMLTQSADEAYGAALMVKTIEDNASKNNQ